MAKKKGVSLEDLMEDEMAKMREAAQKAAEAGARPLPSSISEGTYDNYILLQKSKLGMSHLLKIAYNYTLGWVLPNYDVNNDDVLVPLNAARLVNDLFKVHGHEIIIDGVFNADPHPGNILCSNGQLALIDYGQVKRITNEQRLQFATSLLLVHEALKVDPRINPDVDPQVHQRARAAIIRQARSSGMKTMKDLDETYYEMCCVYFGRLDRTFLYPLNAIQWTDLMQKNDPMGSIDEVDYLVMIHMNSLMLRGLARDVATTPQSGR